MFNENLRNTREMHGISQKELAKKIGIAVTTYRNYENTSREPSYEILIKIAENLNVSTDYLLRGNYYTDDYVNILNKAKKLPRNYIKSIDEYLDYLIYKHNKEMK